MKRWWLVIALLLSVGLNLGILAAIAARRAHPGRVDAQEREMAGPNLNNPNPLPRLPRLADRLGLEGEERRKFLDIQWNLFQETSRLRLRMGEVHRDLKRELTSREPDRQRVDALLAESARVHGALERALVSNVLATRELLGPEREREYLTLVGKLRVPGPRLGPGMGGPGGQRRPPEGGDPRFQDPRERRRERLQQRRLEGRQEEDRPPEE
jgi:Heavy-metal resistance